MRNNFSEESIALRSLSVMLLLRKFGVLREPTISPKEISAHALSDFPSDYVVVYRIVFSLLIGATVQILSRDLVQ